MNIVKLEKTKFQQFINIFALGTKFWNFSFYTFLLNFHQNFRNNILAPTLNFVGSPQAGRSTTTLELLLNSHARDPTHSSYQPRTSGPRQNSSAACPGPEGTGYPKLVSPTILFLLHRRTRGGKKTTWESRTSQVKISNSLKQINTNISSIYLWHCWRNNHDFVLISDRNCPYKQKYLVHRVENPPNGWWRFIRHPAIGGFADFLFLP